MFLNAIGQPLILDLNKSYGPYEEHNGPMLLTSAAFEDHAIPNNWCRQVYGSADDVARFKLVLAEQTPTYNYTVLKPNEPFTYQPISPTNKQVTTTFTLIPAGENYAGESVSLYYMKNEHVRALIVDSGTEYFDFIPKAGGTAFHRALCYGIDVMYIDDVCYMSNEAEDLAHQESMYALVQLIRPKYLYGLRQDNLPKCLLDLCKNSYESHQSYAVT